MQPHARSVSLSAAAQDPRKPLDDAIHDFLGTLSEVDRRALEKIGAVRDAGSVVSFTAELDLRNHSRRVRGVSGRVQSALMSIYEFAGVVDVFVSSKPDIAALVWGSIKFAILVAINVLSYFEPLTEMIRDLGQQFPRFADYQALFPDSIQLKSSLCAFHAAVIRFCQQIVTVIRRPVPYTLLKGLTQSVKTEFQPFVDTLTQHGRAVKDAIRFAKDSADMTHQYLQKKERERASRHRLDVQKSSRLSDSRRLLDFLSSHDHDLARREASAKRHPQTAEWILAKSQFQDWRTGRGPALLCCTGKLGSGKTIICANVINHLWTEKLSDQRIIYFFCESNNQASLRAETVLRNIIRQTVASDIIDDNLFTDLQNLETRRSPQSRTWTEIMLERFHDSLRSFILIDGLDELETSERRDILDVLRQVIQVNPHVRLFLSGRDSITADLPVRFTLFEHLTMQPTYLADDIRRFVDMTVQEKYDSSELRVSDVDLLDTIKDILSSESEGMFLWVKFVIDDLCSATCDEEIHESLCDLPRDLKGVFARCLRRIESQQKSAIALKVFQWVCVARQPLALEQLREVLNIRPLQECTEPERVVSSLVEVGRWCENLVQISEEEPRCIRFAHSSVFDFLSTTGLPHLGASLIDVQSADHQAGEICITYLHFSDFTTTMATRSEKQSWPADAFRMAAPVLAQESKLLSTAARVRAKLAFRKSRQGFSSLSMSYSTRDQGHQSDLHQEHAFLAYAREHWIYHTRALHVRDSTWTQWRVMIDQGHHLAIYPLPLALHNTDMISIIRWSLDHRHYALIWHMINTRHLPAEPRQQVIDYAQARADYRAIGIISLGHLSAARLLDRVITVACGMGKWAIANRHTCVPAQRYRAAIGSEPAPRSSLNEEHLQMAQNILTALNCPKMYPIYPESIYPGAFLRENITFQSALFRELCRIPIVDGIQLERFNLFSKGNYNLETLVYGGYTNLIRVLVECDVDLKSQGPLPFEVASHLERQDLMQEQLESGIVGRRPDRESKERALFFAARAGNLDIIDLLLKHETDLNAIHVSDPMEKESTYTVLEAAAQRGHISIVKRLLTSGAIVSQGGRSALSVINDQQREGEIGQLLHTELLRQVNAHSTPTPRGFVG